ncbi:hypothetical protein [Pseudomonas sp. JV241A]|uniref:hypothetical protein n=1 Tax=Pseudomonas sp. JV241A TaxID=2078785 RepID=UPI00100D2498|nr:hypothetical protein [Pseudomonas sp. JV241A]SPO69289.1 conserved protein of unknown function [Pseudomonas sp. JV241A]
MDSQKILLGSNDRGLGQVGGGARLPRLDLWPLTPDTQEPMTPLCTITERFLPINFIPAGMALTVFITARQHGGAFNRAVQRHYTVNQQDDLDKTGNGYARVILHTLAEQELLPAVPPLLLERSFIQFEPLSAQEEDEELADEDSGLEVSKPLGRPSWLQDPIYEPQRYQFLMQLLDSDIAKASPAHEGLLADGIGYLYVNRQARRGKEGDEGGFFFIQFT